MPASRYRPGITFSKALFRGMGTAAFCAGATFLADLPTDLPTLKTMWPALLCGLVAGMIRAAANYVKNHKKGRW